MVEQADAGKRHGDTVLVAGGDDMVVTYRAAGLCDIGYTALVGAFDVVAEGEEGVRAQRYAGQCVQPGTFLFAGQHFRLLGEELLPYAVGQYVVVVVTDVYVDGVVTVGAADFLYPGQVQYLRVLAQVPDVGLVSCQTGTVDAALLAGSDADGLSVLYFRVIRAIIRSRRAASGKSLFWVGMFSKSSAPFSLISLRPCSKVMPNTSLCSMGAGR